MLYTCILYTCCFFVFIYPNCILPTTKNTYFDCGGSKSNSFIYNGRAWVLSTVACLLYSSYTSFSIVEDVEIFVTLNINPLASRI